MELIIIILSNRNLSYGASLSVNNDREPRIVCKKTNKNYLYITLHDSSGIILDSAEATLAGKKCKYVLIETNDGISLLSIIGSLYAITAKTSTRVNPFLFIFSPPYTNNYKIIHLLCQVQDKNIKNFP